MIYGVTGHRPDKLGGYGSDVFERLIEFAREEVKALDNPERILTGMALGWDQAIANACIELSIPFVACIPCDGQESRWPESSQRTYSLLLSWAAEVVNVNPGPYAAWKMKARNVYMVDKSKAVLALWNGTSGGTSHCVEYANTCRRPVINCWNRWAPQ